MPKEQNVTESDKTFSRLLQPLRATRAQELSFYTLKLAHCRDRDRMLPNLKDKKISLCYPNTSYMCTNCSYSYEFSFHARMLDN